MEDQNECRECDNEENENMILAVDAINDARIEGDVDLRAIGVLTDVVIFGAGIISSIAKKELRHCLIDLNIAEYEIMRYITVMTEAKSN